MKEQTPLVFDIARASFVDGPGLRTVVFFKGCPLRCQWCHNPESQQPRQETMLYPENCIRCGNCETDCSSLARRVVGTYYTPAKLARLILRDRVFYRTSSGGVTFSGGEPLLYIDYLHKVARILKGEMPDIHIAVETCGYFDFEKLNALLLPYIDLFLYDVKLLDPGKHRDFTGKSNRKIIRNLEQLMQTGAEVVGRIPLIPGCTATKDNLSGIAGFFKRLNIKKHDFIPYNPSGMDKWRRLGKKPPGDLPSRPISLAEERQWIDFFNSRRE
jgi:pyruvate formate lyase activating enzyme